VDTKRPSSLLETLRQLDRPRHGRCGEAPFPEAKITSARHRDRLYYDFEGPGRSPEETWPDRGREQKIVDADYKFERVKDRSRGGTRDVFGMNETYKPRHRAHPRGRADHDLSLRRVRRSVPRPHVESTGKIKAFKLLSVAGGLLAGRRAEPMLQRIYGTAFFEKKDLDEHLRRLEEPRSATTADRQGSDLFSIEEDIGGGLVLWHPKGARIRYLIEQFWREEHYANGYDSVSTPHVAREVLWNTSGHTGFYKDNMFAGLDSRDRSTSSSR